MGQDSAFQERPTGEEERRNRRTIIIIVVLVVLCLCLIGVGAIIGAYLFFGPSIVSMSPPVVVTSVAMTVEVPGQGALPTDTPIPSNRDDGGDGDGLRGQIDAGEITLDGVDVTVPGMTIGPNFEVSVTNPGDEEITVIIPCGLIFEPEDSDEQRMMTIQETSVTVPAGGSSSVEAVVACIDSTKGAPSGGTGYTVGRNAEGELLTLASCLCQREIDIAEGDFFGGMGTQLAVWAVSDGTDLSAVTEGMDQAEGAMGDMFGGELADLMEQFLGPSLDEAEAILSSCGVGN
jgi:hypothetical protein